MASDATGSWPRCLLSPHGVLHWLHHSEDLQLLCEQLENIDVNMKKGNMLQLLGEQTGSSDTQRYKYEWQVTKCSRKAVGFAALRGGIFRSYADCCGKRLRFAC